MTSLMDIFSNPASLIAFVVVLAITLTVHEAAHAQAAKWLGDDTAELLGRLTLNPLAHLDPLGTLMLFVAGIGWAKPVPVNPLNFQNPRFHNLLVALAGPAANFLLAIIITVLTAIFQPIPGSLAASTSYMLISYNIVLMIFNLIPIPPLDGSKILAMFISEEAFAYLEYYGPYMLIGLIVLGYFGFPILTTLIMAPSNVLINLLI